VRSEAGSPERILRLSPATDHEAEILSAEDPFLGYDTDTCPSPSTREDIRLICSLWSSGR
jgi:hypothetical protein